MSQGSNQNSHFSHFNKSLSLWKFKSWQVGWSAYFQHEDAVLILSSLYKVISLSYFLYVYFQFTAGALGIMVLYDSYSFVKWKIIVKRAVSLVFFVTIPHRGLKVKLEFHFIFPPQVRLQQMSERGQWGKSEFGGAIGCMHGFQERRHVQLSVERPSSKISQNLSPSDLIPK